MLKKLQKIDDDTNELIDRVKGYLFSVGIRTSRERTWDIIQNITTLPYEMLAERNDVIKYQGQGKHITHKHGNQMMVIRDIGKYELKGVSRSKEDAKRASVKFLPSAAITSLFDKIEVEE